jgi:hypothetical protein
MSESHILIWLLRMYFPQNWKFGSALSKLRNFGKGWGVEHPGRYVTGFKSKNAGQKTKESICYVLCVFIKFCEMGQFFLFNEFISLYSKSQCLYAAKCFNIQHQPKFLNPEQTCSDCVESLPSTLVAYTVCVNFSCSPHIPFI